MKIIKPIKILKHSNNTLGLIKYVTIVVNEIHEIAPIIDEK
jgi:hypothetical protein